MMPITGILSMMPIDDAHAWSVSCTDDAHPMMPMVTIEGLKVEVFETQLRVLNFVFDLVVVQSP